ncbi:MAG TPA: alpha/beta hydrolase [Verrucomicrobiae bacterium]|jgi:acetyl esterase/lipase|nr:alpha/beta hydrolase [Verrucomicrobiae bacterium]
MNKSRIALAFSILLTGVSLLQAAPPETVYLWPNGAPGFEDRRNEPEIAQSYWIRNINNPSITVFLPPKEKANGAAVLIFPGGGHRELVFNAEGVEPARYLTNLGVAAFVLKYRLARETNSPYSLKIHPRQDAQRGLRLIRSRASEWNLDTNRIGIMGFSAGGEVASMVAYSPTAGDPSSADPIEHEQSLANFQIVIYPGPLGIPDDLPADVPPAFFVIANDDTSHMGAILSLVNKYHEAKRPMEVHIYEHGGHGFGMGARSKLTSINHWPQRLTDWLTDTGILKTAQSP